MSDPINGNQNRRTCVILLDLQNEFAKPGGKLHDTVADSIQQNGMLEKVPKLVEIARAKGSLIIHSPGKHNKRKKRRNSTYQFCYRCRDFIVYYVLYIVYHLRVKNKL